VCMRLLLRPRSGRTQTSNESGALAAQEWLRERLPRSLLNFRPISFQPL
jgi:hypothetical protein